MKMSRTCPGMLSSENDDFKFLKTAKNIKCTCTIVRGLCNCFISRNQLVSDQKHEHNSSQRAVLYTVKTLYNVICYNRIFNIRHKLLGTDLFPLKFPLYHRIFT